MSSTLEWHLPFPRSTIRGWSGGPALYQLGLLCATCLFAAKSTQAHTFTIADALVVFKTDGTYQIELTLDLDSITLELIDAADVGTAATKLAAWPPSDVEGFVEAAKEHVEKDVRVFFDGTRYSPGATFPEFRPPTPEAIETTTVLGSTVRLFGRVPEGAREFTFALSRTAARVTQLTVLDQGTAGGVKHLLGPAEESPPYRLGEPAPSAGRAEMIARYVVLGYEHILPKGVDHILFVLGLFLLSTRFRALLWQVTAFTVAHSVTLGLSMYGVVSLPSRIVETLIALSICYVAVENLVTSELTPWRPAIVFGFGLLHGLGFAGVLRELGLPQGEFASSLIAFNVGVELGQLSVVLLAFLAVGWFRGRTWYRTSIVLPCSAFIALIGFYWSVERAFYGV